MHGTMANDCKNGEAVFFSTIRVHNSFACQDFAAKTSLTPLPQMNYSLTPSIIHHGAWDGSAGVSWGADHFLAATDEENTLRIFPTDGKEPGKELLDLNEWADFPKRVKQGVAKEADIEGAAQIGEVIYWISSHARNREGKARAERQVFFATRRTAAGMATLGRPYTLLLEDLSSAARTAFLKAFIQAEIAPKERGGFNIESLCAAGERLLIGFRNPILEGKALLVPLENPRELVLGKARAVLGEPIFLDLGGLGFRDMVKWLGGFLIVAGDFRDRFEDPKALGPRLFWWDGKLEDSKLVALNVDLREAV